MLTLIGLGLWNEEDIVLRGFRKARNADTVYIEFYTSKWHGNIKKLERMIGKEIKILNREDLEEKSSEFLEEAKDKKVVLFVPGDPLVATTHSSLLTDAKKRGIKTEIIHNASIYSAIAETGLHIYRFGVTITIPFPEKTSDQLPLSTYERIRVNKKRDLHTLLLLDVISEKERYMEPNEGMQVLLNAEEKMGKDVFTEDTEIVVFSRAGSENPLIIFGKVKDLINKGFGEPPFVIILPARLHFSESEYLEFFRVK